MKFEYKVLTFDIDPGFAKPKVDDEDFKRYLDRYGRDGWELVSAVVNNGSYGHSYSHTLYLKRRID